MLACDLLPPLFESTMLDVTRFQLRIDDRRQHRQGYFRAAGYRQIGRKAPAGNGGEQRIALEMNNFRIGAEKTTARRLPWHIGINEKQHIGVF